jgi:hypothetical protein
MSNRNTLVSPEMGRIPTAVAQFGVSRSWLYRAAPEHPGLLLKLGAATLVNYSVLRTILATLPAAQIGAAKEAA